MGGITLRAYGRNFATRRPLSFVEGWAATASFSYDADGNRVKETIAGVTRVFVGNHYEVDNGVVKKYYYAGATRVAENSGGALTYLLSDHLGSTALTLDSSGNRLNTNTEIRYYPYGGLRYSAGSTPTSFNFTGQRRDSGSGLLFYNARWYDPAVGRFLQADTIVPEAGNPQSLNRYTYVGNRPTVYFDPTGMFEQSAIEEYLQSLDLDNWQDILKLWMEDDQWWAALVEAQAGDILTTLDATGNMRFSRFEGEGKTKLSGLTIRDDVFGKENLGTARLDELYNGSLGLPAAVVTFNQQGQMDKAYGIRGFEADVSTISKGYANFITFMFGVGLTSVYSYLPAETTLQWIAKTIGTSAVGAAVIPDIRCKLGLCNGDQWLTVRMDAFSPGTENVLPHHYWRYYNEVRYHERMPVFRQSIRGG